MASTPATSVARRAARASISSTSPPGCAPRSRSPKDTPATPAWSDAVSADEGRQQRSSHLGRAFLVAEQPDTLDHLEPGIGERVDHLPCLLHREERIPVSPHELDRYVDALVHLRQIVDVLGVEAAQQAHGGVSAFRRRVQRLEEELVELAVEQ